MGKHVYVDDDGWCLEDDEVMLPSRPVEAAEPESFHDSSRVPAVPSKVPFPNEDDSFVDERPVRSTLRHPSAHQRALVRLVAPLLILSLIAALVVVIRLPDASASQTTITQPDDIQAYIVGAVAHPGVYTLHSDARVYNLLQAAGGALPHADLVRVNQAAHLTDGEEVFVPLVGQSFPTGLTDGGSGKVNINTASAEDMDKLLPISLTTTKKIVAYREAHGPYTSITQLLNVMSKTTFDKIKDFITV
jgi:competence ComEA-like helix-hairpin-helix protein